jgi:hypothetical protein
MLYVTSGSEYLSASVYHDEVTVAWKFDISASAQVHRFHKDEPDGQWTTVLIKMENNGITGKFSFANEDSAQSFSAAAFPFESWQKLVRNGKIMLGGRTDLADNTGELWCHVCGAGFGCIVLNVSVLECCDTQFEVKINEPKAVVLLYSMHITAFM